MSNDASLPSSLDAAQIDDQTVSTIAGHVLDVLRFLLSLEAGDASDGLDGMPSASVDLSSIDMLTLLIVADINVQTQLRAALPPTVSLSERADQNVTIEVVCQSVDECLATPFCRRYDLGVYVDDSVSNCHADQDRNNPTDTSSTKTHALIATRLRDLLAKQSVLYVSSHQPVSLYHLGYVLGDVNTANTNTPIKWQAWQFNLYDYKPTPDWLNARYWANPENFDKYRW